MSVILLERGMTAAAFDDYLAAVVKAAHEVVHLRGRETNGPAKLLATRLDKQVLD